MKKIFLTLVVVAAALVLAVPSIRADILYGAGSGQVNGAEILYEIDTGSQTVTMACTIDPALAPNNPSSPNGLGLDAANNRLYFSLNEETGDGSPSDLYFCDLSTGVSSTAGSLVGQAAGATFDQSTGQYLYIRNRTDDLAAVTLNAAGVKIGEAVIAPNFSSDTVLFRGGDLAVDCDSVLYGSSLGTGGGSKVFFKIDLADGNAYTLLHLDASGNNDDTGFATAKQLSFGQDGVTLYSQRAGQYWTVDKTDGDQTPSGAGVPIPDPDPISMTDLASSMECGIEKIQIDGPDEVGIYLDTPTVFEFEIAYTGPAALIIDKVPAEFEVILLDSSDGTAIYFPDTNSNNPNKIVKSATIIEWDVPAGSNTLTVTIATRENPGKGHKNGVVYKPTSCGDLPLNYGATAYEVDGNGDLVLDGNLDPIVIFGPSNTLEVLAVAGTKPCAPQNLSVTFVSTNTLSLDWDDNTETVDHYNVYRGTSQDGPFTMIAETTESSYDDTGLAPNYYCYQVKAAFGLGDEDEGNESETVCRTVPVPLTP